MFERKRYHLRGNHLADSVVKNLPINAGNTSSIQSGLQATGLQKS